MQIAVDAIGFVPERACSSARLLNKCREFLPEFPGRGAARQTLPHNKTRKRSFITRQNTVCIAADSNYYAQRRNTLHGIFLLSVSGNFAYRPFHRDIPSPRSRAIFMCVYVYVRNVIVHCAGNLFPTALHLSAREKYTYFRFVKGSIKVLVYVCCKMLMLFYSLSCVSSEEKFNKSCS